MSALIIVEHDHQHISAATLTAIAAAQQLSNHIELIIIGYACENVIKAAKLIPQINKIIVVQSTNYQYLLAENICPIILDLCTKQPNCYRYLIVGSTTFGRNILPRIAACLNVELISDVINIKSADTFERLIYNGNIIQTVTLLSQIKCLTIRTINFTQKLLLHNKLDVDKNFLSLSPEKFTIDPRINLKPTCISNTYKQFIPDLTTAKIVVAGGAALKSKENFRLIEQLANLLGAAIGASKSAVDAGFAPNHWQIGQTGKIIAPDLYIAIGISGATQHLAGIKASKIIVAINLDEHAPICKIANYIIIADLFNAIPDLIKELSISKNMINSNIPIALQHAARQNILEQPELSHNK